MTVVILDSKSQKDIDILSEFAKKNNIKVKFIDNEYFEKFALKEESLIYRAEEAEINLENGNVKKGDINELFEDLDD